MNLTRPAGVGQNAGVGNGITISGLTIPAGAYVTIEYIVENTGQETAWSVTNDGTAITWGAAKAQVTTASNTQPTLWAAFVGATPPTSITVTATAGPTLNLTKWISVAIHDGAHPTNPLPSGNIFSGAGGTNVTQAIAPTSVGSALHMFMGDFVPTNTFGAAANCTLSNTFTQATHMTAAYVDPTVNPRTDAASFTIGETDTGGKIAWIAYEVQSAPASGRAMYSAIHPGRGPGNRQFPSFKQGQADPYVVPVNAYPAIATNAHPGYGPGARPFPNFKQGVAPSNTVVSGDGSIAGSLTGQMVGASTASGAFSEISTLTGQMVGASTASGAFSEISTLTGQMVGASTASGAFSEISTLTGQMVGVSTAAGAFSAIAQAIAQMVGASVAAGAFNSTLAATVTGVGASTASGVITETAAASVTGTGVSTASANIGSSASAQVLGVSNASTVVSAAGSISASAVVSGAGASTGGKRRIDGPGPRKRRRNDDDELIELVSILIPLISQGGPLWVH